MLYPYAEIESIQPELFAKLDSEAWFSPISIFKIRHEDTQSKINEALGEGTFDPGQTSATGGPKFPGACIQVFMPTIHDVNKETDALVCTVQVLFRVLENHQINIEQPGGTGLSAEMIAARIIRTLNTFANQGLIGSWYAATDAAVFNPDFHPLLCYDVTMRAAMKFTEIAAADTPTSVEGPPLTITLACATAGATIYYTKDGSYPYVKNSLASLYSAPFAVPSGTVVRYAAYADGFAGSGIQRILVT